MIEPRDIVDRDDIYALLERFYGRALVDDLLAEPFIDVREKGLASHLPVMCDFWETALFRAGLYKGSALTVHREVHRDHQLNHRHFIRWLTLWIGTVDEMYQGPVAEQAKTQGRRIAWAMHRRLTGVDAPELDTAALHQIDALVEDLVDAGFDPLVDENELTVELTPCAHASSQAEHREVLCSVHLGIMQSVLSSAEGPLSVDGMRSSCDPRECIVQLLHASQRP